jgi:hypothetical protein
MTKKKLALSRETLRSLAPRSLAHAHGARMIEAPTKTCVCTIIPNSVLNSCGNSDCCLWSVGGNCP